MEHRENTAGSLAVQHVAQNTESGSGKNRAIDHIERGYKERIAALADEIHRLDAQIDQLTKDLELLDREKAPIEEAIVRLEHAIGGELKYLEKMTEKLIKKAEVTAELTQVLSALPATQSTPILDNRKATLLELQKEIEETEIIVMQKELERQNQLIAIEPKRQEIKALRLRINALQAQKRYIESAGMHRLTHPALLAHAPTSTEDETIIDAEIGANG